MKSLVLIGFMGAGKSFIGKKLSIKLNFPYIDLDKKISNIFSLNINEYFKNCGEYLFRKVEQSILKKNLKFNQIISTGGGIILCNDNRQFLKKKSIIIYLKVNFLVILNRIINDLKNIRPLFLKYSLLEFEQLFYKRILIYYKLADIIIENNFNINIINKILKLL